MSAFSNRPLGRDGGKIMNRLDLTQRLALCGTQPLTPCHESGEVILFGRGYGRHWTFFQHG